MSSPSTGLDAPAVFLPLGRDGAAERFLATRLAGGPWSVEACHGGPPSALLGRAVERFEGGEGMFVSRMTVELLRPVPVAELTLTTRLVRPGKKVQLVEATLAAGDKDVARATALRIRRAAVPLPALPPDPAPPIAGWEGLAADQDGQGEFQRGFHTHAVEHRFAAGSWDLVGPAIDWMRLRVPLVLGEETSSLVRTMAFSDFGNGISGVLRGTHTYVNPDLTVVRYREAEGEWISLDAVSRFSEHGSGMAESLLRDGRGVVGRAVQCLILEVR
ncbi:MAG: thioesterase family protein [Chloroflexi bacterium]|nr:thioesterase family protein [Chloroflexota bacterium]